MMNNLINISNLSAIETDILYCDCAKYFNSAPEFEEYIAMIGTYYPQGIRREELMENMVAYDQARTISSLREKIGQGLIQELQTDDGTLFYRLGEIGIDFGVDPEYYDEGNNR